MNTFINPESGRVHTRFTVIMSAHHTHGLTLPDQAAMQADLQYAYHKSLGVDLLPIVGTGCFDECQGFYDGVAEDSYIISANCLVEVMHLYELGAKYNQQCILVVDHRAETVGLLYMDGQVSRIGKNLEQACDTVKGDYTQIGSKRYVVA
tara:strand:- start:245 stop:694 length:450 start_codon:yes stop_codon:yes gene_type:complete